jgi:mono/diheme cytochrome c family protein
MNWEKDTRIYHLAPNPAVGKPSQFPRKLSETGLFTDTAAQTPAAGVLPFEIAEPMWQDGAKAARFIAPARRAKHQDHHQRQSRQAELQVEWPAEAVLARTISLKQKHRNTGPPLRRRNLERLLLPLERTGTDAQLVGADGEEFTIEKQPWRIHGRAECARCHNNWSGFTLGFQPDQLVSISGKKPEEAAELFNGPFTERLKNRLVSSRDDKADLESKARSWLHANCAHCHRRHGGGSVQLMVNADLPTAEAMLLDEKPVRGDLGLPMPGWFHRAKPEQSVLVARIARSGQRPHADDRCAGG